MSASEYRWAGAVVVLATLAVVLANQAGIVQEAARGAQQPAISLAESEGEKEQSSAETSSQRIVQPGSPEGDPSLATQPFVDEGTEERARARRAARLKMFADPPARAVLLAESRAGLRAYYAGMAEQLRISADEEDRLVETLAEGQLRYEERFGDDAAWSYQDMQTHREMLDAEIRNQLGELKFRALKRYEETKREREEVRRLRERLVETEELSAETAERLIEALAGERIRAESQRGKGEQPEGAFWMGAPGGVVMIDPKDGPSALADARKQLEEQNGRREKVAEPLLTAAQRKAYGELLSERLEAFMALADANLRAQSVRDEN